MSPPRVSVTSEKTARLMIDRVFKLHGLPKAIISDRDPRFMAGLWKAVFKAWGTKIAMSSSYHPADGRADGATNESAVGRAESLCRQEAGRLGGPSACNERTTRE